MAWIKDEDTYDKWSLRVVFGAAATAVLGAGALAVGALAAPAIVPAAGVMIATGGIVEAGAIAHGLYRASKSSI